MGLDFEIQRLAGVVFFRFLRWVYVRTICFTCSKKPTFCGGSWKQLFERRIEFVDPTLSTRHWAHVFSWSGCPRGLEQPGGDLENEENPERRGSPGLHIPGVHILQFMAINCLGGTLHIDHRCPCQGSSGESTWVSLFR